MRKLRPSRDAVRELTSGLARATVVQPHALVYASAPPPPPSTLQTSNLAKIRRSRPVGQVQQIARPLKLLPPVGAALQWVAHRSRP